MPGRRGAEPRGARVDGRCESSYAHTKWQAKSCKAVTRKRKPIAFGKYTLIERVNAGGMAEVFKAMETQALPDGPLLAIKRILPTMAEDDDFITMFLDEAQIARRLEHPAVCRIYELGSVDETHFIAMEFIHGKDLLQVQNKFRKQKQIMPVAMACYVGMRAAEGLDYAHRATKEDGNPLNIIHRDISPQNVLVSFDGEVKIIDFGIAKAQDRMTKTQAGILKGKFGYMSPEQVLGKKIDHRSDLFALGTVIYEMLTGERLFVGESDFSTLEKVRNVDIHPPRHYNDKIPEAVEKIILKALAKDRDQRYSRGAELAADLKAWLDKYAPYDARKLSGWMRQAFQEDIAKDNGKMEEFRQLIAQERPESDPDAEPQEIPSSKTEIFDASAMPGFAPEPDADAPSEKTEIANPAMLAGAPAAEPPRKPTPPPPAAIPSAPVPPELPRRQAEAPPLDAPAPSYTTAPPLDAPLPGAGRPKQPSLLKDILIGASIAGVLIVGVAVYFLFFHNAGEAPATPPPQTLAASTPAAEVLGTIQINEPQGAVVRIDGKEGCQPTPCAVGKLTLGAHEIEIEHPDFELYKTAVKLSGADPITVAGQTKPKSPGKLKFTSIGKEKYSKLRGTISILYNGQELALSNDGEAEIPAGKRAIEVRRAGYQPLPLEVEIPAGAVFELSIEPEKFVEGTFTLVVDSTPIKGKVFLDGKEIGVAPVTAPNLPGARRHTVKVTAEGYAESAEFVRWMGDSAEVKLNVTLNKEAPFGYLVASTNPIFGCAVVIDGKKRNVKTPIPNPGLKLEPGAHQIEFIAPSGTKYGPYPFEIEAGKTLRKPFQLK